MRKMITKYLSICLLLSAACFIMYPSQAQPVPEDQITADTVGIISIDLASMDGTEIKPTLSAIAEEYPLVNREWDIKVLNLWRALREEGILQISVMLHAPDADGEAQPPTLYLNTRAESAPEILLKMFRDWAPGIDEKIELQTQKVAREWIRVKVKREAPATQPSADDRFQAMVFRMLYKKDLQSPVRLYFSGTLPMREAWKSEDKNWKPDQKRAVWQQMVEYLYRDMVRSDLAEGELVLGDEPVLKLRLHVRDGKIAALRHFEQARFLDGLNLKKMPLTSDPDRVRRIAESYFYWTEGSSLQLEMDADALWWMIGLMNQSEPMALNESLLNEKTFIERMADRDLLILKARKNAENRSNPLAFKKEPLDETRTKEQRMMDASRRVYELTTTVLSFASVHEGTLPEDLTEFSQILGNSWREALINPRTGDSPGFYYLKPKGKLEEIKSRSTTPVIFETKDGKIDPDGFVGFLSGQVKRSNKTRELIRQMNAEIEAEKNASTQPATESNE